MSVLASVRPATAVLALLTLALLLVPSTPAAAGGDAAAAERFVALANAARRDQGLAPLAVRGDLAAVAARHSVRMADRGQTSHNGALGNEVGGWRKLGENVGRGPSADAVHGAFMRSAGHRQNLLSTSFTEIGVGVERRGDELWVTQVFRLPAHAPAPTPTRQQATAADRAPAATSASAQSDEPQPLPPAPGLLRRLELTLGLLQADDGSSDRAVALRRLGVHPGGHRTTARAAEHGAS